MEDGDEGPDRAAVARMCIAMREVRPVSGLIRFVAGPDGTVVPDIRNRLPGRGVWITNSADVLRQGIIRKVFQRGMQASVEFLRKIMYGDTLRPDVVGTSYRGWRRKQAIQKPIRLIVEHRPCPRIAPITCEQLRAFTS